MTTETALRRYNLIATHITTNTDLLLQEWLVELVLLEGPRFDDPDDTKSFTRHIMSFSYTRSGCIDPGVSFTGITHSGFSISFICHPEDFEAIQEAIRIRAEEDLDAHVIVVS